MTYFKKLFRISQSYAGKLSLSLLLSFSIINLSISTNLYYDEPEIENNPVTLSAHNAIQGLLGGLGISFEDLLKAYGLTKKLAYNCAYDRLTDEEKKQYFENDQQFRLQKEQFENSLKKNEYLNIAKCLDIDKIIFQFFPEEHLIKFASYICYNDLIKALEQVKKENPKDDELDYTIRINKKQLIKAIKTEPFNPWKDLVNIDKLKDYCLQDSNEFYVLKFAQAIKWENAFKDKKIYKYLENHIDGQKIVDAIKLDFTLDNPIIINLDKLQKAIKLDFNKEEDKENAKELLDYFVKGLEEAVFAVLVKAIELKPELAENIVSNAILKTITENSDNVVEFGTTKLLEALDESETQSINELISNIILNIIDKDAKAIEKLVANILNKTIKTNSLKIEQFCVSRAENSNSNNQENLEVITNTLNGMLQNKEFAKTIENISSRIINKVIEKNPEAIEKLSSKLMVSNTTEKSLLSTSSLNAVVKAAKDKDSIERLGAKICAQTAANYIEEHSLIKYTPGAIALLSAMGSYVSPKVTATILCFSAIVYFIVINQLSKYKAVK